MEANKAPEKIYLQEPTKVRTEKKYDNDVEYVRKDAFIEKALEWISKEIRPYYSEVKYKYDDFREYLKE